jgi:hypothetical protein
MQKYLMESYEWFFLVLSCMQQYVLHVSFKQFDSIARLSKIFFKLKSFRSLVSIARS